MDYLKSEHLKFKRTISNKLIFIVPLITAIFAWIMGGYIGYQYMTLYWWYVSLISDTCGCRELFLYSRIDVVSADISGNKLCITEKSI